MLSKCFRIEPIVTTRNPKIWQLTAAAAFPFLNSDHPGASPSSRNVKQKAIKDRENNADGRYVLSASLTTRNEDG